MSRNYPERVIEMQGKICAKMLITALSILVRN